MGNEKSLALRHQEVSRSMKRLGELIKACPQPTDRELKKLLAIQGTLLSNAGMELLVEVSSMSKRKEKMKNVERPFNMALRALTASRKALIAAAAIKAESGSGLAPVGSGSSGLDGGGDNDGGDNDGGGLSGSSGSEPGDGGPGSAGIFVGL